MSGLNLVAVLGDRLADPDSGISVIRGVFDQEANGVQQFVVFHDPKLVGRERNYTAGIPLHPRPGPGGSAVFDFPVAGRGEVDAMTIAVRPLAGARQVTLRYRVDAAPGVRFLPAEQPGEPATVSLYFQQAGDSWNGKGRFSTYRWYVPGRAVIPLTPGEHSVTVRFDETWTNVQGQPNTALPDGYAAALEDTARIGVAFGSPSRRSHGVYATGPARFTLRALDIR